MKINTADSHENSHNSSDSSPHLKFRSDIEGLRAVAVIIVVACHANFPWMQGGFVGVDVFFVISGYLISGLLIKEACRTGTIKFIEFYSRRLKRLLPALVIMVLGTVLFGALILSPMEQVTQASTVRWVPLWISNLIFSLSDLNYFSFAAESNLFLHTWSLAVEEQFYLVWPVFILALFKGSISNNAEDFLRRITGFLLLVFILFLFLCIGLSYIKPLWGFYLMPSRGWQFSLGALTYILISRIPVEYKTTSRGPAIFYSLIGGSGMVFIILATVFLDETMIYPGYWALIPSIGAALLIFAGSSGGNTIVSKMLSVKPMTFLGKVSYSWYLWHWPVLVFGKILFVDAGFFLQFALVIFSLVLAVATLYLIEHPARNNMFLGQHPKLTIALSLLLMVGVFGVGKVWLKQSDGWMRSPEQFVYLEARRNLPEIYSMGCDDWYTNDVVKNCSFGDFNSEKTAVLIGDSVGAQWFSGLAPVFVQQGWHFVVLTKSACPMVDEPVFYQRIGQDYTVCSDWRDASLENIQQLSPDIVFIGSAAEYDFTSDQWEKGSKRVISQLSEYSEKIFIIASSYRLPFDGPGCLARKAWQFDRLSAMTNCDISAGSPLDEDLLSTLNNVANEFENVGVLNLNSLICPDNICSSELDGRIVYRDYQHLSSNFVESISPEIFNAIENVQFGASSNGSGNFSRQSVQ